MAAHKILVVDDNEDFALVLSTHLKKMGYETACATNGLEATNKVAMDPPDLILLDYAMPAADGEAVHRRLEFSLDTRSTPIIFISGIPDIEKYVPKRPNVCFLRKPVDLKELVSKIRQILPDGEPA